MPAEPEWLKTFYKRWGREPPPANQPARRRSYSKAQSRAKAQAKAHLLPLTPSPTRPPTPHPTYPTTAPTPAPSVYHKHPQMKVHRQHILTSREHRTHERSRLDRIAKRRARAVRFVERE